MVFVCTEKRFALIIPVFPKVMDSEEEEDEEEMVDDGFVNPMTNDGTAIYIKVS